MDAKEFYQSRNRKNFIGYLSRFLTRIHSWRPLYPFPGCNLQVKLFNSHFKKENQAKILLIGSNEPPETIREFNTTSVDQLNINKYEHVNIVADAEKMTETIPKNTYDFIVATNMLEHTYHPWKVLEESSKILKPGGLLYISVPWIFPLHGEPYDFYRFSVPCIKNLIKEYGLIEVESGSQSSCHSALYYFLKAYFSEIFSFNSSILFYALDFIFFWVLFPVGLLERFFKIKKKRTNYYTDAIVYIVAQKPSD